MRRSLMMHSLMPRILRASTEQKLGKGIVNATLGAQAGAGAISGNASNNKLEGNQQNNTLSGGDGADTLTGGGGNDTLQGGEGSDTVVLSGSELDYTITRDASKLLTYIETKTGGAIATLSDVEYVQFKDALKSVLGLVAGDTTAPTLSSKSPASGATAVALAGNLKLTFSEVVEAGSGSLVLKSATDTRTISVKDTNQVIFSGDTLVLNPSTNFTASSTYSLEIGAGVVKDLSGNAYAGLSGYSFATQVESQSTLAQFMSLSNVKLVKDKAANQTEVSFSVNLNASSFEGQKINGLLLDLDYDTSLVSDGWVTGVQYTKGTKEAQVWQFITPNLSGDVANGKIVALASSDANNPVVVGTKTMDVTLVLKQAVDSFAVSFNGRAAHVNTVDGVDHVVGTSAEVLAQSSTGYALKANVVHWKGLGSDGSVGTAKALPEVSFVKGSQTLKSSDMGVAVFESSSDSAASLVLARPVSEGEKAGAGAAVNLQDAIAILKMIVGLNVNSGSTALSPYQVVAADFNRDGSVALTDAIDVLKQVVGLAAPSPSWVLLDQTKVASTMTMETYNTDATKLKAGGWMSQTLSVDLEKTSELKLAGVLTGDVDGSWAALNLTQFGVY